ncbi:hypothetical protein SALBM135S_06572 [Streptomyces alboniger]
MNCASRRGMRPSAETGNLAAWRAPYPPYNPSISRA